MKKGRELGDFQFRISRRGHPEKVAFQQQLVGGENIWNGDSRIDCVLSVG